jgi:hypothetical protein
MVPARENAAVSTLDALLPLRGLECFNETLPTNGDQPSKIKQVVVA